MHHGFSNNNNQILILSPLLALSYFCIEKTVQIFLLCDLLVLNILLAIY